MMKAYRFLVRRIYVVSAILAIPWIVLFVFRPFRSERAFIEACVAFFVIALPLNAVLLYGSTKRWRSLRPMPGETVTYSESWASGGPKSKWSKTLFLRTGNTQRLIVEVTTTDIYVRPYWFLQAGMSDVYHVLQRIPLPSVSKCEIEENGSVLLEWSEGSTEHNLVLRVNHPEALQAAVGPRFVTGPSRKTPPLSFAERYLEGG